MRFFVFFQLFSLILLPFSFSANASSLWDYIWGPPDHNEVRPYLEEAKVPHNSRWADDEWTPQDWVDARGGDADGGPTRSRSSRRRRERAAASTV